MDATCKVQNNIHVFRLIHNMCPGFWVHISHTEALHFYSKNLFFRFTEPFFKNLVIFTVCF